MSSTSQIGKLCEMSETLLQMRDGSSPRNLPVMSTEAAVMNYNHCNRHLNLAWEHTNAAVKYMAAMLSTIDGIEMRPTRTLQQEDK